MTLAREIKGAFPALPAHAIGDLIGVITYARLDYLHVDRALKLCRALTASYSVEAIRSSACDSAYFVDIDALYVNVGESAKPTLLYDVHQHEFLVTTVEDWVLAHPEVA